MNSSLYNLGKSDFVKGAITAVFAGILTVLAGVTSQAGFNLFEVDWGIVVTDMLNISVTTFIAYLMKNFMSDEEGNFAGMR